MSGRLRDVYALGECFNEFIQMYTRLLKEFGTTMKDPCLKHKTMFLKSELLDFSIFYDKEERLALQT